MTGHNDSPATNNKNWAAELTFKSIVSIVRFSL